MANILSFLRQFFFRKDLLEEDLTNEMDYLQLINSTVSFFR